MYSFDDWAFWFLNKNFINFRLELIEKQGIINFDSDSNKLCLCRSVILRSLIFGRGHLFVYFSILFRLTIALPNRSISFNFFVFRTSEGISSKLAAFLFLISILRQVLINNFFGWFISDFERASVYKFLKCFFHFWALSYWLVAFSTVDVIFLPLPLFTICHANHDCLSTKFFILLIWPWMNVVELYFLVRFSSLLVFQVRTLLLLLYWR